ncbi:dermonecrotic toxin domain-containing protein [Pseudomonas sp. NPDC089422]|uniref:dermonecrotic toxin domain-containing protein n=1 Tax=Pseudomonas sp. NPDC089422 TaxID=3364466 RepID=UPI0038145688
MAQHLLIPVAEQQLRALVLPLVNACPDMRQLARDVAKRILRKHGHAELDPDDVYLNRFMAAQSSPYTFSGWQHHDAPFESYSLPQLVMHRFNVEDQDNSDLLSYLAGFYLQGPGAEVYDEHNEVPIAPKDVLDDFWQIDFSSQYHQRLADFWQNHAQDYRTLAKINFLSKVLEVCAHVPHSALADCARQVAQALTGHAPGPLTLEQLLEQHVPDTGIRVCTFDIGGYVASDFLRIEMEDGRQLLYTCGDDECLHLFATRKELYWWVLINTNQAGNRARFLSHFPAETHAQKADSAGLNHLIDLLFFNWGGDDHHALNQLDRELSGDAFSALRDSMRQRMIDDAHFTLRSNGDLRKQMWIGYLKAFGQIAAPLAALDWPIALAAVGAGLAETGLNIDQAVNGHTTSERHTGTVGAIFAAVDTLFNATLLASAGAGVAEGELPGTLAEPQPAPVTPAEPNPGPASPADIQAWIPKPYQATPADSILSPFGSNEVLSVEPGSGDLAGIYSQNGHFYVLIDDQPYQVRLIAEMKTWVVIDPENPFSFYRNVPLRRTAEGGWQPLERAVLRGGGLTDDMLRLWGKHSSGAAPTPLPPTPYEVPEELQPILKPYAENPGHEQVLSGIKISMDTRIDPATAEFRNLRDILAKDAQQYLASVEPPARPDIPALARNASAKEIIRSLYESSDGMVIGESHSQLGSKRFLIDNMSALKKAKVKVLYVEHFMTDFNQAGLEAFQRSGKMPTELQRYVRDLDRGYGIDQASRYSFESVLRAAQKLGIRIQSIDCMASYRQAWEYAPSSVIRQQMMNFYAHEIIQADQAIRGSSKWVALMGNSHGNTFEGVLGVSELQGAIGLRVEDIQLGHVGGIEIDPGLTVLQDDLSVRSVKGDLRLQVPIAVGPPAKGNLETVLASKGAFAFDIIEDRLALIHRSNDGQLKYTPIIQDGQHVYITRPGWPWVSGRRLRDLSELRTALQHHGLHYKLR